MKIDKIIKCNNFVVNEHLINISVENHLSLEEFIVLIYLDNNYVNTFDPSLMNNVLGFDESKIMLILNDLINKKLVSLNSIKDEQGKLLDIITLDGVYTKITEEIEIKTKLEDSINIFATFEKEFGRPLSSIEVEIIKNWIDGGTTEELVVGALKEAIYNGVFNIRYVDKIITEWNKKNYKSLKDVKTNKVKEVVESEQQDLFDYDWTNDYD